MAAFYQDLNENTPTVNPLVKDAKAVAQWIENLLMTNQGEVLFKPTYGADLTSDLFDLIDEQNGIALFNRIKFQVETYDPEVSIVAEESAILPDVENNAYYINLAYTINGFDGQVFKVPLAFNQ